MTQGIAIENSEQNLVGYTEVMENPWQEVCFMKSKTTDKFKYGNTFEKMYY